MAADPLLAVCLEAAVPLWIGRLARDGYPTPETIERCRAWTEELCGPGGEDLLFRSKKPGQTAERFNDLAYVLAVMAFCPGGITFLGRHWEYVIPPLP